MNTRVTNIAALLGLGSPGAAAPPTGEAAGAQDVFDALLARVLGAHVQSDAGSGGAAKSLRAAGHDQRRANGDGGAWPGSGAAAAPVATAVAAGIPAAGGPAAALALPDGAPAVPGEELPGSIDGSATPEGPALPDTRAALNPVHTNHSTTARTRRGISDVRAVPARGGKAARAATHGRGAPPAPGTEVPPAPDRPDTPPRVARGGDNPRAGRDTRTGSARTLDVPAPGRPAVLPAAADDAVAAPLPGVSRDRGTEDARVARVPARGEGRPVEPVRAAESPLPRHSAGRVDTRGAAAARGHQAPDALRPAETPAARPETIPAGAGRPAPVQPEIPTAAAGALPGAKAPGATQPAAESIIRSRRFAAPTSGVENVTALEEDDTIRSGADASRKPARSGRTRARGRRHALRRAAAPEKPGVRDPQAAAMRATAAPAPDEAPAGVLGNRTPTGAVDSSTLFPGTPEAGATVFPGTTPAGMRPDASAPRVAHGRADVAPAVHREVLDFVSLRGGGDGQHNATIRIHPPELGSVAMHLKIRDRRVHMELVVDNRDVKSILDAHQSGIRAALAEHGLALDSFNIGMSHQSQAGFDGGGHNGGPTGESPAAAVGDDGAVAAWKRTPQHLTATSVNLLA